MSGPNTTSKVLVRRAVRDLGEKRRKRYQVRWTVDGTPETTRTFETEKAADTYRGRLQTAVDDGKLFDRTTREPVEWAAKKKTTGKTVADFVSKWIAQQWPDWSPTARRSKVEECAAFLPALVTRKVAERRKLYSLCKKALHPTEELTLAEADLWRRFCAVSLPLAEVDRDKALTARAACNTKLDGTPAKPNYASRRRGTLAQVLLEATAQKELSSYPLTGVKEKQANQATDEVDAAEVGEVHQVEAVLASIKAKSMNLYVLFCLMFYAGLRPSEAVNVRWRDLVDLPVTGWGTLRLQTSAAEAGRAYTDTGTAREERGLKHRKQGAKRPVRIPPVLVAILLDWRPVGAKRGDLVCPGQGGTPWSATHVQRTWAEARQLALPEADEVLLHRPYSLRHTAATLWLGTGVSPKLIARRLGHSVNMLLSIYADVLPSQEEEANARIEDVYGAGRKPRSAA